MDAANSFSTGQNKVWTTTTTPRDVVSKVIYATNEFFGPCWVLVAPKLSLPREPCPREAFPWPPWENKVWDNKFHQTKTCAASCVLGTLQGCSRSRQEEVPRMGSFQRDLFPY